MWSIELSLSLEKTLALKPTASRTRRPRYHSLAISPWLSPVLVGNCSQTLTGALRLADPAPIGSRCQQHFPFFFFLFSFSFFLFQVSLSFFVFRWLRPDWRQPYGEPALARARDCSEEPEKLASYAGIDGTREGLPERDLGEIRHPGVRTNHGMRGEMRGELAASESLC